MQKLCELLHASKVMRIDIVVGKVSEISEKKKVKGKEYFQQAFTIEGLTRYAVGGYHLGCLEKIGVGGTAVVVSDVNVGNDRTYYNVTSIAAVL